MALRDGPRQLVAGALSAAAFLGLFIGLALVWWLAFAMAVVVYAALLIMIPRRPANDEIRLSGTTTKADILAAGRIIAQAADRLQATLPKLPQQDARTVEAIVATLQSIRNQVLNDPEDFRRTRRLVNSYLGVMVDTVERYADLAAKAQHRQDARLETLAEQIRGFLPILQRIDAACLENDLRALESQVDALSMQMKRG